MISLRKEGGGKKGKTWEGRDNSSKKKGTTRKTGIPGVRKEAGKDSEKKKNGLSRPGGEE